MPLDAERYRSSDPKAVLFDLDGHRVRASKVGEVVSGYVSHFATCPMAAKYRTPRRRA